ncbi:MAG: formate dehydrogenase accessory sulfurtransferase FdhD [Candidatus Omnitrophica bacterium]|nr:formate dehydrogenase accessory sulfurtransferase FdhD [Candidatus Omnitrophota bacterium]
MEKIEIFKVSADKEEKVSDLVTEEVPVTVYVNGEELATLLASPSDLKELAVGFLFTSGMIKDFSQIKKITVDTQAWCVYVELLDKQVDLKLMFKRMYTSGCGRGTLFYHAVDVMHRKKQRKGINIQRDHIFNLMRDFQTRSNEFKETGGVHSAALAEGENILVVREDIGRHNALDKIIGYSLIKGIEFDDKIVLTSGRVSSEVLLKVQKTKISVIISRSAPTNQAVKHARDSGITLIGFARGKKMNIYSQKERIGYNA